MRASRAARTHAFTAAAILAAAILAPAILRAVEVPMAEAVPRVAFEKEVVNLGQIVRGSEAKVMFVVRNTGSEVLKILSAKPG